MRLRPLADAALAAWVLLWIVMGIAVAREVRSLADISDNARDAGLATERAGDLLDSLSDVPLVGDRLREPAATIRQAGARTVAGAERGRERAKGVGTLLGISIAVIPSLPLLVLYLPGRMALERDRRLIRRGLREHAPGLQELLATRAVAALPYRRLRAITPDPVRDLREGRHEALAAAELDRLGLGGPGRRYG